MWSPSHPNSIASLQNRGRFEGEPFKVGAGIDQSFTLGQDRTGHTSQLTMVVCDGQTHVWFFLSSDASCFDPDAWLPRFGLLDAMVRSALSAPLLKAM